MTAEKQFSFGIDDSLCHLFKWYKYARIDVIRPIFFSFRSCSSAVLVVLLHGLKRNIPYCISNWWKFGFFPIHSFHPFVSENGDSGSFGSALACTKYAHSEESGGWIEVTMMVMMSMVQHHCGLMCLPFGDRAKAIFSCWFYFFERLIRWIKCAIKCVPPKITFVLIYFELHIQLQLQRIQTD